jgi:hypothetical protein
VFLSGWELPLADASVMDCFFICWCITVKDEKEPRGWRLFPIKQYVFVARKWKGKGGVTPDYKVLRIF